jgi:hypothetical protein
MEAAITFIALFAAAFGSWYIFITNRNKERMALIEKGADASLFNTGREGSKTGINWSKFTLKIGMLAMGIALGIIVGSLMANESVLEEEASYSSMVFFFGGLSLVLFYIIDRKTK